MSLRQAIAGVAVMLMITPIGGRVTAAGPAARTTDVRALNAADRERLGRAIEVSTLRLDEWLGASRGQSPQLVELSLPYWSPPASMMLESQAAFVLARARFDRIARSNATERLLDGVAWHLQSRIVEQLFDLTQHLPGHHAAEVRLFGDHIRWGLPSLVMPASARDERVAPAIARAAAAVATLENIVGWPALAGTLRSLTAAEKRSLNLDDVARLMEGSLGVPVGWFFATLDAGFHLNYRVTSVATRAETCGNQPCHRIAITVARDGHALYGDPAAAIASPIPLRIEFDGAAPSTIWWSGNEAIKTFTVDTELAPIAVTLDPERSIRLDDNRLDQRWMLRPALQPRPAKALAAWLVWLQHAALTYSALV